VDTTKLTALPAQEGKPDSGKKAPEEQKWTGAHSESRFSLT
jgi:hypothetical protein